ncbi:MAG: ATP-binding cassette domain-containing protein [Sphingobacteriales bacterium]|nr:MAG: ATP-binding cassette domain-containing protein [Sphingobacteriales bacterium]
MESETLQNNNTENIRQKESRTLNKIQFRKFLEIFRYVMRYKGYFFTGLFFLGLSTITSLAFPYMASLLADAAQGTVSWNIKQLGWVLLAILIVQSIFSYLRIVMFAYVSEYTMADIRKDLYARLITLPVAFFEQRRVGELTSRLSADVAQLQDAISINLAELLRQFATLVVGLTIIGLTSWKLTLLMVSTFPVAIVTAIYFGKFIRTMSKKAQDALANAGVVVEETLQSVQAVKAFTNEKYETLRYNKAIANVVTIAMKTAKYRGAFVTFLISAVFGGIVIVLWYGATLVHSGSLTIGELIRFILYTVFIGGAIGGMGDLYGNLQKALGASERVVEILNEHPEVDLTIQTNGRGGKTDLPTLTGDIEFRQVSFAYPTRKDITVLKDLSLYIHQGEKVAFVGASGAGKSTIVQLLMRLYPLDSGAIYLQNININTLDLTHLRQHIGIVPQEVILFGGTIRENILYGKPDATETEVANAAKKANAWEFISSFPEGLETLVGERGVKLSGGQRQRIAIARAILKDPSVLILDEATSSLDAESERLVQEALDRLMENRTTIIIAHRLSTIRKVNTIYVLENGEIAEKGTHEELAAKNNGLYQYLLKLQFEKAATQ